MSWPAETRVVLAEQMTARAADRRCPNCGRKFALSAEYGTCRWVPLGKCDPQ